MPESVLGRGLIFEDLLPFVWVAGTLPQALALGRLNADNHQLLGAEASLDEVRVHEALKDESPALLHELQRLEFKLNVLLRLTSELAKRNSDMPPARPIKLWATGLELTGEDAPPEGATGVLDLYINSTLPQPLKLPATVVAVTPAGSGDSEMPASQLEFTGLSDAVVDLIEKLIFRRHRRLVAGSRLAPAQRS